MIIHLSDRRVLRVAGAERAATDFLNGLLTIDVERVATDRPLWAGLLTAQGKYLADMIIFAGGEGELLLDLPTARYDAAVAALKRYRLRQPITIEDSMLQVFAGWNEPQLVAPDDPRSPALGQRWLGATASVTGTLADYRAHRIRAGIPGSEDFAPEKLMWLESGADLLNGVDFTKGCFVGQENTARMNYRAKVRKRVVPVTLASDPGGATEIVTSAGKAAGTLTGHAMVGDERRGMALLRLEYADEDLRLGDAPVTFVRPEWLPTDARAEA
ncbi:MAG: folate-binding protein [Pseudomonadota bacterium]